MSTTHGYLPFALEDSAEGQERVGFSRKALAEMTQPELDYVAETRHISTLTDPRAVYQDKWKAAYAKLKAATK